jgi:hypothetical protein
MRNVKLVLIGALLILTSLGNFFHFQTKLRRLDAVVRDQTADLERLTSENRRLLDLITGITNASPPMSSDHLTEILRLRGQVARLRTQAQPKDSEAQGGESKKLGLVSKVDVKYAGRAYGDELVRTNSGIKIGDRFNPEAIDDDVRRLYESGYFRKVSVEETAGSEGHALTYVVECTPRLKQVIVRGNIRFDDKTLIGLLSSKVGGPLDDERLFFDARNIRSLYERSGFPSVEVKPNCAIDQQSGEGTITIEITENP